MSTRAIIAIPDEGPHWKGRYHHYDGYPSGLGAALAGALAQFDDYDAMVKYLVHDERVGWSTICDADLTLPPTWTSEPGQPGQPPQSYTARGEEPASGDPTGDWWRSTDPDHGDIDWVYVLKPDHIDVLQAAGYSFAHRGAVAYGDIQAMKALG